MDSSVLKVTAWFGSYITSGIRRTETTPSLVLNPLLLLSRCRIVVSRSIATSYFEVGHNHNPNP